MPNFARLETHQDLQVLTRVETKDVGGKGYGPCLITRCDPSITVEVTEGPWSDDETGWDKAEAALVAKDLAEFAKGAKGMAEQFSTADE